MPFSFLAFTAAASAHTSAHNVDFQLDVTEKYKMQTDGGNETETRKQTPLLDINFEPAHPPRHKVVDRRSDGSANTADDSVHNRKNKYGAEPYPKTHHS